MKIKTKVTAGVIILFGTIVLISVLSLFSINRVSRDAENIIKDNYESVEHMRRILLFLDHQNIDSLEANIHRQALNVTEAGEQEQTDVLRQAFDAWKKNPRDTVIIEKIRAAALTIQELNMNAITRKNEISQATSREATTYAMIIISLVVILTFTLIVNFPGYIANPIVQLTQGIKAIANKNYEERLNFDRTDEFQELADAFNQMAEKLDEYEHSNLARIIFEKERIETLINRMNDPVVGLDENRKIVFVNEQARALLSLQADQLIGRYAPDVAVENDLLRAIIQNEESYNGSATRTFKIAVAGHENYFSKENIPIKYTPKGEKQEKSIGQVILLRNITTYKEKDLAKTNFIATISHELKTPIASIQMCSKLLQDKRVGNLNHEQQGILKTLADETDRLSKITNELLDLSQAETGNLKLDIRKSEPRNIIDFALEAVKFHAERKRIRIDLEIKGEIPSVQADADKTTWVLVNLLTNAIRYSMENDRLVLTCQAENDKVRFSVQDFGQGIESKYLDKLFDKFFQVPGTSSGTGLGLAISKEFIEAQGGTIDVRSEFGKGSNFSFTLKQA